MMEIDSKEENSNQIINRRKARKIEQEEGMKQTIYILAAAPESFVFHCDLPKNLCASKL